MCHNKCSDNINKANILKNEFYEAVKNLSLSLFALCNTRFNSTYKQSLYGHDKPGKVMEF